MKSLQLGRGQKKFGKCYNFFFNLLPALKEILSDEYKDRASRVHPLPWLDTTRFELDKVYTRLDIVQRENSRSHLTDITVELSDIFDKHEYTKREHPRTILIEGSPGMGKTTLSLKIACEWAMEKMPSKFPPVQLVLLIKCRDMTGDILEAIYEQLLPLDEDSLKNKLHTFIKKQPEKILLVVDGLDEITQAATDHVMNLLTGKCLRKCYVVATSRQDKGLKVRKYFDTLLEIKGYSESDTREYITRYFQGNDDLSQRLIENLRTDNNLQTLATNPLHTVLLCVVFEDYGGQLPSTVTELYNNVVYCITKRYREKCDSEVEDKVLETSKETLGKLAYKGLLEGALSFRESELNDDCTTCTNNHCTKMGFVYKEGSKQKIKPDHTYWFLHKTFQEYLAAFYLTKEVKTQKLTVGDMIDELKDTERFMQVLKFVSALLHKKEAVYHKEFVEKLGRVLLQLEEEENDYIPVLDILCELLSESSVDKEMAGIIHQFLPADELSFDQNQYHANRILPRILNQLCTKDGVNKEVNINHLHFDMIEISTSELTLICDALKEKLKVGKLQFKQCSTVNEIGGKPGKYRFTAETMEILAKALCQNCNLEVLHFAFTSMPDVGPIMTALTPDTLSTDMAAGTRGSVLHTLVLNATGCYEQSALAAAKMLRANNTLKTLDMSFNSLGCKGVTHIAEALKSNRMVKHLGLMNTDCGDDGAATLADMLRNNKTLTKLSISNDNSLLQTVNFPQNKVGDKGAVALAEALRVNNSLKKLHLLYNNITYEGFKCLTEALLENTTLESLCIIKYKDKFMALLDQDKRERVTQRLLIHCYCNDDL